MTAASSPERVAVIVVHGIADQVRGQTASDVAVLLAAGQQAQITATDLPIAITPVDPAVPLARWNPRGWIERISKSMLQSLRSDFVDAHHGMRPADAKAAPDTEVTQTRNNFVDHGVRFTDYLFAKSTERRDEHEAPRNYEMPLRQVRSADRETDVFEMYWADLSRLGGGVARILAELFTLLFHLAKLGTDTISLADVVLPQSTVLHWLARMHRWANWVFSRVLALLFLQLLVCVLLLVPSALFVGHERSGSAWAAALVALAVAVGCVYRLRLGWVWGFWAGLATGAVLGGCVWTFPAESAWITMLVGLMLLLGLYRGFLGY
ncbi:MAG TPA: hypothetical protein VFL64_07390, partial [Rhizobacter sp.]|nr:hypothetical protein [Rhizobacter sp.]